MLRGSRSPASPASPPSVPPGGDGDHEQPPGAVVLELAGLGPTALNAVRLFAEAVLIPTALLVLVLHLVGMVGGLAAALGWCLLTVVVRWVSGRRVSGTVLLCAGLLGGRALLFLATSSAFLFLLQPALGSAITALVFLGSALVGRPVTQRLARDFVDLPAHVLGRRGVRRMFTQVSLLFGLSRVADVLLSLGFLRGSLEQGLVARGMLSPLLTVLTVALCTWWGWRCLTRDGVRIRLSPAAPVGA